MEPFPPPQPPPGDPSDTPRTQQLKDLRQKRLAYYSEPMKPDKPTEEPALCATPRTPRQMNVIKMRDIPELRETSGGDTQPPAPLGSPGPGRPAIAPKPHPSQYTPAHHAPSIITVPINRRSSKQRSPYLRSFDVIRTIEPETSITDSVPLNISFPGSSFSDFGETTTSKKTPRQRKTEQFRFSMDTSITGVDTARLDDFTSEKTPVIENGFTSVKFNENGRHIFDSHPRNFDDFQQAKTVITEQEPVKHSGVIVEAEHEMDYSNLALSGNAGGAPGLVNGFQPHFSAHEPTQAQPTILDMDELEKNAVAVSADEFQVNADDYGLCPSLESVLGKERYERLMQNISAMEDDDDAMSVDSGMDVAAQIWKDSDTEVSKTSKSSEEECLSDELGLETHRPEESGSASVIEDSLMTPKRPCVPPPSEIDNERNYQQDKVKVAFSADQIYARASMISHDVRRDSLDFFDGTIPEGLLGSRAEEDFLPDNCSDHVSVAEESSLTDVKLDLATVTREEPKFQETFMPSPPTEKKKTTISPRNKQTSKIPHDTLSLSDRDMEHVERIRFNVEKKKTQPDDDDVITDVLSNRSDVISRFPPLAPEPYSHPTYSTGDAPRLSKSAVIEHNKNDKSKKDSDDVPLSFRDDESMFTVVSSVATDALGSSFYPHYKTHSKISDKLEKVPPKPIATVKDIHNTVYSNGYKDGLLPLAPTISDLEPAELKKVDVVQDTVKENQVKPMASTTMTKSSYKSADVKPKTTKKLVTSSIDSIDEAKFEYQEISTSSALLPGNLKCELSLNLVASSVETNATSASETSERPQVVKYKEFGSSSYQAKNKDKGKEAKKHKNKSKHKSKPPRPTDSSEDMKFEYAEDSSRRPPLPHSLSCELSLNLRDSMDSETQGSSAQPSQPPIAEKEEPVAVTEMQLKEKQSPTQASVKDVNPRPLYRTDNSKMADDNKIHEDVIPLMVKDHRVTFEKKKTKAEVVKPLAPVAEVLPLRPVREDDEVVPLQQARQPEVVAPLLPQPEVVAPLRPHKDEEVVLHLPPPPRPSASKKPPSTFVLPLRPPKPSELSLDLGAINNDDDEERPGPSGLQPQQPPPPVAPVPQPPPRPSNPIPEDELAEYDDIPVDNDDDEEPVIVSNEYSEFVKRLMNDTRFNNNNNEAPKLSNGVPRPSKSRGRPQSAGSRPKSAGTFRRPKSADKRESTDETYRQKWATSSSVNPSMRHSSSKGGRQRPASAKVSTAVVNFFDASDGVDHEVRRSFKARPSSAERRTRRNAPAAKSIDSAAFVEHLPKKSKSKPSDLFTIQSVPCFREKVEASYHRNQGHEEYSKYRELTPRINSGELSFMQCLPDELLLEIFSYLTHSDLFNCVSVCHHFKRVGLDFFLWQNVTLKKKTITNEMLEQIGQRRPVALSLIQCKGSKVTDSGLRELFRHCADSLKELNVTGCIHGGLTGDNMLLHAANRCPNLSLVDVSWCNINDPGLMAVVEMSRGLHTVSVNGCQSIGDESIHALVAKHGIYLHTLELFGCFNVSARALVSIGSYCNSLKTLNLGQCWKVTETAVGQLSHSLGQVEHLDLRGCKQITDATVAQVLRNCPHLDTLALANCPNLTDNSLQELAVHGTNLKSLDVCGCKKMTSTGVKSLAMTCTNLKYLDLSSTGVTHRGVSALASYSHRRLEVLKLNFCKQMNLSSLVRLAKNCHKLKKLYIYGVTTIRTVEEILAANPSVWIEK